MPVPLTLKIFKNDQLVGTKDFDRDIIKIGRLASAHLCLDDEKVSRIHSVIECGADGTLAIIDMGSVDGTWVNGKRVNKGTLQFGDSIKLGVTTLLVESTLALTEAGHTSPAMTLGAESTDPSTAIVAAEALHRTATQVMPALEVAAAVATASASQPASAVAAPAVERSEPTAPQPVVRRQPLAGKAPMGTLGLSIRLRWGQDQILAEHLLKRGSKGKPAAFTVGSAQGVNFTMGDSKFGGPSFVAARADEGGFAVRFTGKMKGAVQHGDESKDLTELIESRGAAHDGDAYSVTVRQGDLVTVDLGGVLLEATLQPIPKPVFVPFIDTLDFTVLNIFLVMFFLAALFVISAVNRDAEGDAFADDLNGNQARIAKLIIKPPEIQKNKLLQKLEKQKQREQGEMAAKSRGDEGQMGKKDAPKRSARAAPKGDPNNKDEARLMAQKIFGGGSGISTIFGHQGLGGQLKSAMGNMFGAAPGDAGGFGGLGLRGSGGGGGGVGDTIGIGGIGTKGRGGGTGSYGNGVGVLGGKKGVDIGITSSEPTVMGSLDKELIRQVIKRNIGQIRYCYESQLNQFPNLNGKVAVHFIISASGMVSASEVKSSTANNAGLETCVAGRVRTWQFPKPKGGGVVSVTYPFVFTRSGE